MKSIYILGSLNMDMVINSPYMPAAGETIAGYGFLINPGGKGANQAVAAGKLGGKVFMAGAVGDDAFGNQMIQNLNECNVGTSCIRKIKGKTSGIAIIVVINGDNRIILSEGANSKVTTNDVDILLQKAKKGDIFLSQLENDVKVVGYALKSAKEKGLYTILNPAPANIDAKKYFKYVDLITPNQSESALLTGEVDYINAIKKFGIPDVIITLGGDGYYYEGQFGKIKGDCIKVNIVDTTAAGDTFCGALAVKLSEECDIENAMSFASKCASLACTKEGAQQSIPFIDDVNCLI